MNALWISPAYILTGAWLCSLAFAGCRSSHSVEQVWSGSPLATCETSAECESGSCLCGMCTSGCEGSPGPIEGNRCGENQGCFEPGSLVWASQCGAAPTELTETGVCLAVCALDEQCGVGQRCVNGACVSGVERLAVVLPRAADAGVPEVPVGLGEPSFRLSPGAQWLLEEIPVSVVSEQELAARTGCPDDLRCATLDTALRQDECIEVRSGCGLIELVRTTGINSVSIGDRVWYDSFDSRPIGSYGNEYEVLATRDVSCEQVEVECSSCAGSPYPFRGPSCSEAPNFWPPSPPAAVPPPGCSCEVGEKGSARISMECFCSVYGCPSLNEGVSECLATSSELNVQRERRVSRECGLIWLTHSRTSGEKYGYDPSTGELVAAHSFSPAGPVSKPCNAFAVHAGVQTDCEKGLVSTAADEDLCFCRDALFQRACESQDWIQELPVQ